MTPGQYVVFHSTGWGARLIQLGTLSYFNHTGVLDENLSLIEAQPGGVVVTPASEWQKRDDWVVSRIKLSDEESAQIVSCAKSYIGTPYGWLDIVALALVALGIRPKWLDNFAQRDDALVCSQLVAIAYDEADLTFRGQDPWTVTPGDLALAITRSNA